MEIQCISECSTFQICEAVCLCSIARQLDYSQRETNINAQRTIYTLLLKRWSELVYKLTEGSFGLRTHNLNNERSEAHKSLVPVQHPCKGFQSKTVLPCHS